MEITSDSKLEDEINSRLRAKYATKRDGLHLTDLIYCITKTYWKQRSPLEPTEDEVRLWAIGVGLEEVLLSEANQSTRPEPVTWNGITFGADYLLKSSDELTEMKTTRISFKDGQPTHGYPAGWVRQMMGYAIAYSRSSYRLLMYLVIPAKLVGKRFTFTASELVEFSKWLLWRKDKYLEAEQADIAPEPFVYAMSWECARCPYLLLCHAMKDLGTYLRGDSKSELLIPEAL